MFNYFKTRNETNDKLDSESFIDPASEESRTLYRSEAFIRSSCIFNLSYTLSLALLRGGEDFHGQVIINFNLSFVGHQLSIDYKGKEVKYIIING